MIKNKTVHMIGNAHIDPVWLWQWPEGFHEVLATFRSALDRMKEYDDFCFTASSAAYYQWVEQTDPAMFEEIRKRVAEGRWEVVGGWWIECDCNIPGGESFARQALYGQRYFREKFGVTARVGYSADSFGHHAMLPQILKKSGLDYYVFLRPGLHEKGLPSRLFWWESSDGSRVLAFRIPYEYCAWGKELDKHVRRCVDEMKEPLDEFMCFYGVGNHGGGPTVENIESIHRLNTEPDLPRLECSTTARFLDRAAGKNWPIPVVHDELGPHACGCYSAHSAVKRWNRQAENALLRAEKLATIASQVTRLPYPTDLAHAWKCVLFNQFHDILAGTSVKTAYEDAHDLYGEALAIAGRHLNAAVQSLVWHMHIPPQDSTKPIAVFNPHAWAAQAPIEVEVGVLTETDGLVDEQGTPVPTQRLQSQATTGGRSRLGFVADLPPMGYRLYRLVPNGPRPAIPPVEATPTSLENERFRLSFDPRSGCLTSLYDKQAEVEVLAGPAARAVVLDDHSDTWGHNIFRFGPEVSSFSATRMVVVERGPVRSTLRVESAYNNSTLVQDFTLYRDLDRIDVRLNVDWHERHKVLKLRFPLNIKHMRVTHEIPYGSIERCATGDETPFQSWVDVSGASQDNDEPYGFSLINDGKYSVDVNVRDIGLTVLRSPIYAHHMPAQPDPEREYPYLDQGIQHFTYALAPHRGSHEIARIVRRAAELNQPPVVLLTTYRSGGKLPSTDSYLSVDADNLVVTVLKKAEDNGDVILRAYETAGKATRATLRLPLWERSIEATFGPHEIKTFRIPANVGQEVVEANLLEDAAEE